MEDHPRKRKASQTRTAINTEHIRKTVSSDRRLTGQLLGNALVLNRDNNWKIFPRRFRQAKSPHKDGAKTVQH